MKQVLFIFILLTFNITGFSQEKTDNSISPRSYALNQTIIQSELKIFPNPCKNKKITIELNSEELTEIRLTNIAGKEILLKKIDIPVRTQQLELHSIPNGIYLIQIKTTGNKTVVKKLLVSGN